MLEVPGRILWDFWTLEHGGLTWLWALSAPRGANPDARHNEARVDAFTSADLRSWTPRGTALEPGPEGAWDDLAIWTGSVAADPRGGFAMLYTGRSRAEGGRVQRIGLARSDDLLAWAKHPVPVIEADPALYRTRGRNGSTNWRDPWLAQGPDGLWRAWITAQHPDGPVETAGTVALAESPDLLSWAMRPPVVADRLTEHLEVPQVVLGGEGLLLNVYAHHVPPDGALPRRCMSLLYRRSADGASYGFDRIVEDWPTDVRYVIKEVRPGLGLCWQGLDEQGRFHGVVSDPFPLPLA